MKRQKLRFTWEILDKILKLEGKKVYNTTITDDGLILDVYGGDIEHAEGAVNECVDVNTIFDERIN